jgi:alanine racemase
VNTDLRHRAWAEIDLSAFERNLGKIKAALPDRVRYIAVVKADAYGHGMPQIVSRLLQCDVDCFAVANVYEAADVREIGPGADILVLGALLPEELEHIVAYDLTATVSSIGELEKLAALGAKHGRKIPVHIKVDTGMGRLGVWHENAGSLIALALCNPHIGLRGLFTHFSSAESDPEFTRIQRVRFLKVLAGLPKEAFADLLIHADNSGGLESFSRDMPFNAVRIGLLQYGHKPGPGAFLETITTEPVLSFRARVGLVKDLPTGTDISYGRTHTLKRDSRIAVITAGYGDGISTSASSRGKVIVGGERRPILGRVTMDQTVVDITGMDGVREGDAVTLIGRQGGAEIRVEEFCADTDCIAWEALCTITKRVKRIYRTARGAS